MTPIDQVRIDAELAEALEAQRAAAARIAELHELQREMRPVWKRLVTRRVDNSFGEEYDLIPRRWGAT